MNKTQSLLISLAMGLLAFLMVFGYVKGREKAIMENETLKEVVVAKVTIKPGTAIDENMVVLKKVPTAFKQPETLAEVDNAKGRVAVIAIPADTQILEMMLTSGERSGLKVPKGMLGVTLPVRGASALAGLLLPGDRVDVLSTVEAGEISANGFKGNEFLSKVVVQNVLVLAVDQQTQRHPVAEEEGGPKGDGKTGSVFSRGKQAGADKKAGPATVTVAATQEQALALALVQQIGPVTLVMHSQWDGEQPLKWSTDKKGSMELLGVNVRPSWVEITPNAVREHE